MAAISGGEVPSNEVARAARAITAATAGTIGDAANAIEADTCGGIVLSGRARVISRRERMEDPAAEIGRMVRRGTS